MSDHADIVREWIGGCLALHGFREDCPACVAYRDANAALDALVAERDEALERIQRNFEHFNYIAAEAEAEVARLREALEQIADPSTGITAFVSTIPATTVTTLGPPSAEIARAALADKEGT